MPTPAATAPVILGPDNDEDWSKLESMLAQGAPPVPAEPAVTPAEPTTPTEQPAPVTPAAPISQDPPIEEPAIQPEATPPADPVAPAPPAPNEDLNRVRLSHLNPVSKRAASIMARNPDLEPEDAVAMAREQLRLPPHGTQSQELATPAEPEVIEPPVTVASIQSELDTVSLQLKEISTQGGMGGLYDASVHELTTRQSQLMADLAVQRVVERQEQAAQSQEIDQEQQAFIAAQDEAINSFPELSGDNPDDPLFQAVENEVIELTQLQAALQANPNLRVDPDTRIRLAEFSHPNYPKLCAARHAAVLGRQPVAKAGATAAPTPAHPQKTGTPSGTPSATPAASQATPPRMMPVSGNNGSVRVEVAPSNPQDDLKSRLSTVDPDDWNALDAALGTGGDSPKFRIVG